MAEQARLKTLWRTRAQQYGARSVLNLRHRPEDYQQITDLQTSVLMPLLRSCLTGMEQRGLDFGCGAGRFSGAISAVLGQERPISMLAYDVCQEILDLAPPHAFVDYTSDFSLVESRGEDELFDVVWICLVLGGLPDKLCEVIVKTLSNRLADGGRLFLVEHVEDVRGGNEIWSLRTLAEYQSMFFPIRLRRLGGYFDCGNAVTVLAGTRRPRRDAGARGWARYLRAEATLRLAQIAGFLRRGRLERVELDRYRR